MIQVSGLCKDFKVYKRKKGFVNNLRNLVRREYETVHAVRDVSFTIKPGELVGYVGANGAGKSTTIKMLCGIVTPTAGNIAVNGIVPHQNRRKNAMQIGVVFGQRSQLNWDLPCEDTFDLYRRMYKIPQATFRRNVDMFVEMLGMQDFFRRPVRGLSLGQKMRAEIAVALLHDPGILYLDEPTIGLDVDIKDRIRKFARALRDEKNTTIILTTHDMADIDEICERLIMIDRGQILVDSPLADYKHTFDNEYYIEVEFAKNTPEFLDERFEIAAQRDLRLICKFYRNQMPVREAMAYFANNFDIVDVNIRNPNLDEIVRGFYAGIEGK
ncbi:MAG: ATP-binding cassette domain-containing protein [Defluviitaleaceae bacterium]|nr:ATP-binding cassette domain-containing protein [Defluviitaleaceae bacterium]